MVRALGLKSGDPEFKSRSDHPLDLLQRVTKTLIENKHFGNGDYFVIIASSSHPLLLTEYAANGLAAGVNIENERFTVVCPRCR